MPYTLRASRKYKGKYWVINEETGKKYSNKPIPKTRAKRQLGLLWGLESGSINPYKTGLKTKRKLK
jgi:hypothetical protein